MVAPEIDGRYNVGDIDAANDQQRAFVDHAIIESSHLVVPVVSRSQHRPARCAAECVEGIDRKHRTRKGHGSHRWIGWLSCDTTATARSKSFSSPYLFLIKAETKLLQFAQFSLCCTDSPRSKSTSLPANCGPAGVYSTCSRGCSTCWFTL